MDLNFKNVARFIRDTAHIQKNRLTVDLSNVNRIDAFSATYIACYASLQGRRLLETSGIDFISDSNVILPITEFIFPAPSEMSPKGIREIVFGRPLEMESEDQIEFDVTYKVPIGYKDIQVLRLIKEAICRDEVQIELEEMGDHVLDIIENAKTHPKEPFYFLRCQYDENEEYLDIVIADIGLGIRGTLSKKSEYEYLREKAAVDAVKKSLEPNVTSKNELHGTGLTSAYDFFVEHEKNMMYLSTEDGCMQVSHENGESIVIFNTLEYNLDGVQILMRFGCEND